MTGRERALDAVSAGAVSRDELEQSERELSDFFEHASVGLHWVGPDGTILRVNRAELELLGYERHEYVGHHIAEFHVDQDVIADILARLTRRETLNKYPARLRCKDGGIKHVQINSNSLWRDGEFVHTRCITVDVTDRRQSEESRALLAAIVTASDDAIISKSLDGTILSWNVGAERQFGYSAAEAVGRSFELIVPEDCRDDEHARLARLKRGERLAPFETIRMSKAGQRIDVSVTASPIRDDSNEVIGTSEVARDITEWKHAQQALHASEERYRALVESQADMICRFRPDGTILFANEAYAQALGTTTTDLLGSNFWNFIPVEEHEGVRSMLDQLSAENPEVRIENRFETIEGQRWTLWTNRALEFSPEGRLIEAQSTGIDITLRKEMEQALRDSDRRKDEFLATLAHELRNPLAPIGNSLEIMKIGPDDPELVRRSRETIERQWSHLVRLVDDLLDLSRITRDKLELRRSMVELEPIVREAVETCGSMAECCSHRIETTLPDEPISLRADPVRLMQILNNLLHNACKFSPARSTVRLRVERVDDEVVMSIQDDGIGLPPDKLESVFEMFAQVHGSMDQPRSGLGIGLTLVKRLIELHGGRIEASSEGPGRGSEFVLRLPLPARDVAAETGTRDPAEEGSPPRRVLIVEDNADSAETLSTLLQLNGHETHVAYDGLQAIEAAKAHLPDIILLDLGLPKLSGIEACRRIRAQAWGKALKIVALTGWGQDQDRRDSADAGFDDHFVKPLDQDTLMRLLASLG